MLGVGTGLTILTGLAGQAQDQPREKNARGGRIDAAFFDRLDVNKDGAITLDEIPEDRRERVGQLIERLDGDKDGKVTRKEFDAGVDRVRPNGDRPEARKRPDGERRPEGEPRPDGERRPDGDRRPEGTPRPPGQGDRPPQGPGGPDGRGFGPPPFFQLIDTDGDGKLSREELSKAAENLMKRDLNEDGFLTPDELFAGLPGGGPPGARPGTGTPPPGAPGDAPGRPGGNMAAAMIRRVDKNGDAKLSKDEAPELMRNRFDQIDTNKDGFIDEAELNKSAEQMRGARGDGGRPGLAPGAPGGARRPEGGNLEGNRERVAAFLREHDKDADGRIGKDEFPENRAEEFGRLDTNGDGFLNPPELAQGLAPRDAAPGDRPSDRPARKADRKPEEKE
jgi:collagen type III alpha